jgi:transcriptional antiterminator
VPSKTKFRDLTDEQCILLFAILQMQKSTPPVKATVTKIVEATGLTSRKVHRCLHKLRRISKCKYVQRILGKKPTRYRVPSQFLVTQSDTAEILLLLLSPPFLNDGQIPYDKIINWLSEKMNLTELTVRDKLKKATEQEYLTLIKGRDDFLEVGDRVLCEQLYLQLVAKS